MDGIFNFTTKLIAFFDRSATNNPRLRAFDWTRDIQGLTISDPKSEAHKIDPYGSKLIFDGTRTTTIASNTTFDVTLSSLDPSRYRFTYSGGTNPTLRTDRGLTLNTFNVIFASNLNSTVTVTTNGSFSGSVAGDIVFLPSTTTGDSSSPFSVLNCGFWQIINVASSTSMTLARLAGDDFTAVSETVAVTNNNQFQVYSAAGVQIGDKMDLSVGFSTASLKTYEVVTVTSRFVEVISTTPIAIEAGVIPTATGMVFYTECKNFIYIESDQDAFVRLNGDSSNNVRLQPFENANPSKPATFYKVGPSWSLTLVNKTGSQMNAVVLHGE